MKMRKISLALAVLLAMVAIPAVAYFYQSALNPIPGTGGAPQWNTQGIRAYSTINGATTTVCVNPTTHTLESCGGTATLSAGAQGTGSQFNPPTGGSGLLGYLSGLYAASQDTTTPSAVKSTSITTGGATPYHLVTAASTNSTLVSTGPHTVYGVVVTGLNATAGYLRISDGASAPTCASSTFVQTYPVIGSATQQGGVAMPIPPQGMVITNGLGFCFTGGSADNDNTSGPAGVVIDILYK